MKIKYIGLTALVTLVACYTISLNKNETKMLNVPLSNVIENNNDNTLLDEILETEEEVSIKENDTEYKVLFSDAIKKLEDAIYISDKIEEIDKIKNHDLIKDLDDTQKSAARELSPHDIALLVMEYQDDKTSIASKNKILPVINYLNNYNKIFILENGINLSEKLLSKTLSGNICNYFKDKEYNNCEIHDDLGPGVFSYETVTHKKKEYKVKQTSGFIFDATTKLNALRAKKKYYVSDYKEIRKDSIDAFNYSKYVVASKLKLKGKTFKVSEKVKDLKDRYNIG